MKAVASKRRAPSKLVMRAGDAFHELTGQLPTENVEAWRVFFEAVRAVVAPSRTSETWLKASSAPWLVMSESERRADVLPRLKSYRTAEGSPAWPAPDQIRQELRWLDPRFADLTDERITEALQLPEKQIPAELSLAVGAFGDRRRRGESHEAARKRVSTAFRTATQRSRRK